MTVALRAPWRAWSCRRCYQALCERAHLDQVVTVGRISSTNDYLKNLVGASRALPGNTLLVIAREQAAGRGQFERSWSSPPGGLYASLLYWPERPIAEQSELSLLCAEVLCEVLHNQGATGLFVKAPNDVYAPGGKLAGILLEASGQEGWLVIGIGVNVRRVRRPSSRRRGFTGAAYLADDPACARMAPQDVAGALFPVLLDRIGAWDAQPAGKNA